MSLLNRFFGKSDKTEVKVTTDQNMLLEKAYVTVRNYLVAEKPFPLFAMALQRNGEVMSYLPTEEFAGPKEAVVGLLQTLIPLARAKDITAAVIVTPMEPPPGFSESSAMFDLEQIDAPRVLGVLPYRYGPSGVEFGQMSFQKAQGKLFAS